MNTFKIKLTKQAKEFIEIRTKDFALYEKRGGAKLSDLIVGVYAELGAYEYLFKKGIGSTRPDFFMHKKKSFGADLIGSNGVKYHVKGQSLESQKKYGTSFLFQRSDRIIKNQKEITKETVICCSVDIDREEVTIVLVKPVKDVILGECRLEWFRQSKVALYLEDQT